MEKMQYFLEDNFLKLWHHFLSFEIDRSKAAVKLFGSANGYLVFQVICWHHVLVITFLNNHKLRDEAVKLWFKISKAELESSTVLTYSLISDLTSLSIETVRRQVKKLEENNWVSYSKKKGVILNSSDKNIEYLVHTFNKNEVKNLGRFMDVVCKELKNQKLM